MADLRREFDFYLAHKAEFLAQYQGRFLVLKDEQVVGVFDDRLEAIRETAKKHPVGTFIVQHVVEGDEQAHYHSRVVL